MFEKGKLQTNLQKWGITDGRKRRQENLQFSQG